MKFNPYSIKISVLGLLLLLVLAPLTMRAQTGAELSAEEKYKATLQAILSQLLTIKNILLERQGGAAPAKSAAASNSSGGSARVAFVPDGSTFGTASVITSVLIAPSNGQGMSITMKSDKFETVVASVTKHDDEDEYLGGVVIGDADKPYSAEVIYYRYSNTENPVRESSGRLTEAEVALEMRAAADSNYELADNMRRFLLENPVTARVPEDSGRTRVLTNECYEEEDREMVIDFIKRIFDADNLRYKDLDTIVQFSVPALERGYSWRTACDGTFDNTLEQ